LLTQLIGKGSFGEVYRGLYTDKDQAKKKYPRNTAIKIENDLTKTTQLANEVNVLEALQKEKRNRTCFPRVYASGS
jgi:predicted Ser/Thr protein kinase